MNGSESTQDLLARLIEEWQERIRRGERPDLETYAREHPAVADELRELLPGLAVLEDLKGEALDYTVAPTGDGTATAESLQMDQLGDFRILREVGRGGMGVVYEAVQVSLGRRVALKVLPMKVMLDAKQRRRFEREARSAAKLHHTNIVPVFGVGEQDGVPYYVMQFIQGLGLDGVLDEVKRMHVGSGAPPAANTPTATAVQRDVSAVEVARSLVTGDFGGNPVSDPESNPDSGRPAQGSSSPTVSTSGPILLSGALSGSTASLSKGTRFGPKRRTYWQSIAALGSQVADALEYAHKQGVLHRDIKPSNLLLDTRGTVWVTDFGLAKADDQDDLTHTGDILGTLRYMPPEAFDGRADARGDVYSLGLTLYELLALRPAYDERDRHRLVKQVTTLDPSRLDGVNRSIPRDLVTIVHKAIDRDATRRYQTARELADDLDRFLADEPILARRAAPWERALRWVRRKPAAAALIGVSLIATVAVAFAVVILLYSTQLQDAKHAAEAARAEAERARDAEGDQRRMAEAARQDAERQREAAVAARHEAEREREKAIRQRGLLAVHTAQWAEAASDLHGFTQGHPDDLEAWLGLGQAHAGLTQPEKAVQAYTRALALAPNNLPGRLGRADQETTRGRLDAAIADFKHAFQVNPNLTDIPEHVNATTAFARVLYERSAGWQVLQPSQLTANGGATLKSQADGTLFIDGSPNNMDTITIVARTNVAGARAIRLELLAENPQSQTSQRGTRPVYYQSGNFILTEFAVSAGAPPGQARPVAFSGAWSDFALPAGYYYTSTPGQARPATDIKAALDGDPKSGWSVLSQYGRTHTAVFLTAEPIGDGATLNIRIRFPSNAQLRQNMIGRFRLSLSPTPPVPAWECLLLSPSVGGWTKLAAAQYLQGDKAAARAALDHTEKTSAPADIIPRQFVESVVLDRDDDREKARTSYKRAGEQLSSYSYLTSNGDLMYRWLAVEASSRWIDREPGEAEYRRTRGELLAKLENRPEAISDLTHLLTLNPADRPALLERGDCFARSGQPEKAAADFAAAGRLNREETLNWHSQKIQQLEYSDWAAALPHLDACLVLEKGKPGEVEFLVKRGRLTAQLGRNEPAAADFAHALQLKPNSPDALLERGGLRAEKGETELAVADFAAAHKLSPKTALAWHTQRLNRYEYGVTRNNALALLHLGELIAADERPEVRSSYLQRRAWAYRQELRYAEAAADFGRMIELTSPTTSLLIQRAECLAQSGEPDKAAADLTSALKLDPIGMLVQFRARLQTLEYARNWSLESLYLDAVLATKPGGQLEVTLLRRQAVAHRELGRYAASLADCDRVLALQPGDVEAVVLQARTRAAFADELQLQGKAPESQEQRKQARATLDALLTANPDSEPAAAGLADFLLHEAAAWRILEVAEVKSAGGATMTRLPDGSVLPAGKNPPSDTYSVTLRTKETNLKAFRVEALPDPSLPLSGPGRATNGNLLLGEIRIRASAGGAKDQPVALARASASAETRSANAFYAARDAIDDRRWTTWGILPQPGQPRAIGERQSAVFTTREAVAGSPAGMSLSVAMECGFPDAGERNLGRFRLWASSADHAMHAEQIRLTAANGWAKLAAARLLLGDKEGAEAASAKAEAAITAADGATLLLGSWVRNRLGSDEPATLARDRVVAWLRKKTDDVPLPMPTVAAEVLTRAVEGEPDPAVLHLWHGRVLEHLGDSQEAAAAYTKALAANPNDVKAVQLRADFYQRMRDWKQAAADLRRVCELKPDEHWAWFSSAPLVLWTGDEEGYRRHREHLLRRFGNSTESAIAERTAKVCSLLPGTPAEAKTALELARRAVSNGTPPEYQNWYNLAAALAAYRAGELDASVEYARKARELDTGTEKGYVRVMANLIEALSLHGLGRTGDARTLLAKAQANLSRELPDHGYPNPDGALHDLVACLLLEREAEAKLNAGRPPLPQAPAPRAKG